jgi:aryl-alcohol dehydrogenase-like predicted oxidoreductase/NAD-dependent dihydropyrimidine dehydrogenase PreA subunit
MARSEIGTTGMTVERNGFGALPIQRITKAEAVALVRRAHEGGMDFFDTARAYTDSEEKLGAAFGGHWDGITVATKTMATSVDAFWDQLHTSLKNLQIDCIDLYQFHNPAFCPRPGGEDGLYDAALEAKQQGKIAHIGITNHRLNVAREAIESGLYETLQFPFSYLAGAQEAELVELCQRQGVGFIAMKGLSGGLITNAAAACAWVMQASPIVVPIWGIQREGELDEFLSYIEATPALDDDLSAVIAADRAQLQGDFCRGCGYCLPCPQDIDIPTCARASLLLRRAPKEIILGEEGRSKMRRIEECIECGQCAQRCPYGLDTPELLKRNYRDFQEVMAGKAL